MSYNHIIKRLSSELTPNETGVKPVISKLNIKAVLFDIYGTLLISGSGDVGTAFQMDDRQAFIEALKFIPELEYLAPELPEVLLTPYIVAEHDVAKAAGVNYPEVDIREIWEKVVKDLAAENKLKITGQLNNEIIEHLGIEVECRLNPTWTMPNTKELLSTLKEQEVKFGIVSNAQFYTPYILSAHLNASVTELGFSPEICIWSYALKQGKPSPLLFSEALAPLLKEGIEPEEVLYVGNDMRNDIWTASQAGCKTALFTGDKRSLRWRKDDDRCVNLKPDCIITDLLQVLDIIS